MATLINVEMDPASLYAHLLSMIFCHSACNVPNGSIGFFGSPGTILIPPSTNKPGLRLVLFKKKYERFLQTPVAGSKVVTFLSLSEQHNYFPSKGRGLDS